MPATRAQECMSDAKRREIGTLMTEEAASEEVQFLEGQVAQIAQVLLLSLPSPSLMSQRPYNVQNVRGPGFALLGEAHRGTSLVMARWLHRLIMSAICRAQP